MSSNNNNQNSYGIDLSKIKARNSEISIGSTVKRGNISITSVNDLSRSADESTFENSSISINSNIESGDLTINETANTTKARHVGQTSAIQSPNPQQTINQSFVTQSPDVVQQALAQQTPVALQQTGDTVFIVDGTEILAFKDILSAKSPVFFAIIKKAPANSKIKLNGLTSDIFKAMLKFLYDENFEVTQPFAEQLLEVGQKYKIAKLKSKCEEVLKQNISFDSVVKFLELAEKNQAEVLKTKCINYIRECPRIQTTDQFLVLMENDPSLMVHFVNLE